MKNLVRPSVSLSVTLQKRISLGNFLVHPNSDSAKREKEAVTLAICVLTMWYEEKVSNFEIAVAKLKETL